MIFINFPSTLTTSYFQSTCIFYIRPTVVVTSTKRARIFSPKNLKFNNSQIASQLGIHPSTVSCTLRKWADQPNFYAKTPIPGRPRLLSDQDIRHAEIALGKGEARDATDLQHKLFPNVYPTTVWQALNKVGLYG